MPNSSKAQKLVDDLIKKANIDTSLFGKNKAVPLSYLYEEVAKGEATLKRVNNKLHRYIKIIRSDPGSQGGNKIFYLLVR